MLGEVREFHDFETEERVIMRQSKLGQWTEIERKETRVSLGIKRQKDINLWNEERR